MAILNGRNEMFREKRKINFSKSGSGSINARLILSNKWLKELGITKEENEVEVEFYIDRIIVRKAKKAE